MISLDYHKQTAILVQFHWARGILEIDSATLSPMCNIKPLRVKCHGSSFTRRQTRTSNRLVGINANIRDEYQLLPPVTPPKCGAAISKELLCASRTISSTRLTTTTSPTERSRTPTFSIVNTAYGQHKQRHGYRPAPRCRCRC